MGGRVGGGGKIGDGKKEGHSQTRHPRLTVSTFGRVLTVDKTSIPLTPNRPQRYRIKNGCGIV